MHGFNFPVGHLSVGLLALALSVSAAPPRCKAPTKTQTYLPPTVYPTATTTCDIQLCVDYIDACGQGYGGCFLAPECGGTWPTFTAPPCSLTITPTPTPPTVYPTATSTCDISLCVDNINSCGQMFGGCFLIPECGGTVPTFVPPPCPTTTTAIDITTTTGTACDFTICVDSINTCGQMFGGCYLAPECGGTVPRWTTPPCGSQTPYPPTPTPYDPSTSLPSFCSKTSTICTDRFNPCTPQNIGTCFLNPECGGKTLEPVNTVCSTTTTARVTSTVGSGGYVKVKRVVEWRTWTTTVPEVTPTVNWEYGL